MEARENDEPRREPGRHQKLATAEYVVLSFLANISGAIFWWLEQRRWRLADQLEQLELKQ